MASDARQDAGTNSRPLDDSIAGIAPGIPDDARGPGADLPPLPSDADVAAMARKLGVPDLDGDGDMPGQEQPS